MMLIGLRVIVLFGLLSAASTADIGVAVLIGQTRVPLGVQFHFPDGDGTLPPPGELPVEDSHDRAHGARTFCNVYESARDRVLVEMFDSNLGMHTARLSRVATTDTPCTALGSPPTFLVGEQVYSLDGELPPTPPTWTSRDDGDATLLEREWTYSDSSRPNRFGTCYARSIYIRIERDERGTRRSITVQNWEEPGC